MSRTRIVYLIGSLSVILLVAGCNQSPYELAPVTGVVTVDGMPLTAGQVMFAPRAVGDAIDAGKPAIGWLDENGAFELSTYSKGDGAVVGEHMVTLYGPADDSKLPAGIPSFKRVPVRGKALEVKAGEDNTFAIDVSIKDIQPPNFQGRQIKR